MACFIVPMVLAIVTTFIQVSSGGLAKKLKLSLLNGLLWGGVVLLAVEHVWHGEIVPWAPYLTAMATPADTAVMLSEMGTIGTSMAVVVSLAWFTVLSMTTLITKKCSVIDGLGTLSRTPTTIR